VPNWSTAEKVRATIQSGDSVEWSRGVNRAQINKAANNEPLLSEEESEKVDLKINNRWGEMMIALANGRRQYINNFTTSDTYFTISIPKAPEEHRAEWEGIITESLNDKLKNGERAQEYFELHHSRWAAVVCHGIGPVMWEDKYSWIPRYVAIEDLRIPTDTERSFRNLTWFSVRVAYTPGELSRKAFSKNPGKYRWNKPAVTQMLKSVKECNFTMAQNNYNWETEPEKFEELRKQNSGYWSGDAMPTINLWHFFHKDEDGKWYLKVVQEGNTQAATADADDVFVCECNDAIADTWRNITHVQYGDLNNKAPFMYHSVRSLGFSLYEPCYWTDFTRCRLLQHTLDQFNWLLRVADPADRARAQIQVFQNLAVLRPGVSIVPSNERHQVEANLVNGTMEQLNQLQSEASSVYTQGVNDGQQREQTAFETGVKVQQNNAMLSGLMNTAFTYEKFFGREICRRFCLAGTDDEDCKEFQNECKQAGIPIEWMDVKKWRVEPTSPLGNGNPTMAYVEAENALKLRPMLDPASQQKALRDAATQMVGAKRAADWIKASIKPVSDASAAAAAAFPAMMMGLPPQIPDGLNPIQQIQTLFLYTAGTIAKIQQTTKVPTMDQLTGLMNVAQYLGKLVQGMAGDKANEPAYKKFAHELSQINNEIKKLQMMLNNQMQKQAQQNGNGQAQAEVQKEIVMTQAKVASKAAETRQKLKDKELASRQKLRQDKEKFVAEQQRQDFKTVAETARAKVKDESKPKPKMKAFGE
jgi:hypothetical protein